MEDITKMFNLPGYVKGKSFAAASKYIQNRFKDRTDKESLDTQKDLLDRLRQSQEYVKAQEQAKQKAAQDAQAMKQGDAVVDDMGQVINRNDPRVQNGSLQPNQPPQPPDVSQDPNAQAAMQEMNQQVPNQPQQQPQQGLMGQIQQACGGMMKKYSVGGKLNPDGTVAVNSDGTPVDPMNNQPDSASPNKQTTDISGTIGSSLAAAGTFGNLGMKAFGKTGVDTSGATSVNKQNLGMDTASGALQGGMAGADLGNKILPGGIGSAIGGGTGVLFGGAAGLIGGERFNKDAQKSQVNNTYMKASQANNTFEAGGQLPVKNGLMNKIISDTNVRENPTQATNDYYNANPPAGSTSLTNTPPVKPSMGPMDDWYSKNPPAFSTSQPAANDNEYWANQADKAVTTGADAINPVTPKGIDWKGLGKTAAGSGEALKYAPALMDAYQLATLKRPKGEGSARIDARYKPQYTDENAVLNAAREETNAARGAIRETSGGSASEARANLLATQLNSMKGLSAASQAGREANLAENRQAQSFNLGIDQANLAQSNLQQDINDRNRGAYDTQKSKLLASLGTTAGEVGKEELYKKYPEMMGLSYNWRGKYEDLSDEEKAKITASSAADKKKLKYSKTGSTKETE